MPPKAKITKEMITQAAFAIAREQGAEHINARSISEKLGCSTQPVLYHFKKIEDIKRAVYRKADEFHSAYITDICGENPLLEIGMNYIRFASQEQNLFRFLFQSNEFSGRSLSELINDEALSPVLAVLSQEAEISIEQAKIAFRTLFLAVHGYASLYANNELTYSGETAAADLNLVFTGAILALKGEP